MPEDYDNEEKKEEKYYAVLFIGNTGIVLPYNQGIQVLDFLKQGKKLNGYSLHNIGTIEDFKIGEVSFTIINEKQYLKQKIENLLTNE